MLLAGVVGVVVVIIVMLAVTVVLAILPQQFLHTKVVEKEMTAVTISNRGESSSDQTLATRGRRAGPVVLAIIACFNTTNKEESFPFLFALSLFLIRHH